MRNLGVYKYFEHYRCHKIFIYREHREWWWTVDICHRVQHSAIGYFNLDSAILHARKFIEKKTRI